MAELTGFDKRTIFRCLDTLEKYRLIERVGLGKNRRFSRGSILNKILTTVTNRTIRKQDINLTTATLCHQNSSNRDIVSYKKTSLSLKRKETVFSIEELQEQKWYLDNPSFTVKDMHLYLFKDIPNAYLSKKV